MSNIKKDLLLCFLLENYCKNNNYDFTTLYNKLKDDDLINISYKPLEFNKYINNIIMAPQSPINISNIEEKEMKRFNNYNIIENIGNGSFGSVFKCVNNIDQQSYALKIIKLSPTKYETILREVRLMSTFDHPNIIKYYCSWIDYNKINLVEYGSESESSHNQDKDIIPINYLDNYYLYIQMELCKNSLSNYLDITPFDYNTRLFIFKNIVNGLNYLHINNIIHRDLKPSNILFDKNNNIKITDFGMSIKQLGVKDNHIGSDLFGTYIYSAPESLTDNYYSIYSDIYSLGIILFELLNSFSTIMEKNIEINRLKDSYKYTKEFVDKYQFESEFILKLINNNATQRLNTSKILSSIKILFKEK
jgi:eukaryotic translation initiation factor 2-alpha kinase 1